MDDDGHDHGSGNSSSGSGSSSGGGGYEGKVGSEGKDPESKTRSFRVDSLLPKVGTTTALNFFRPFLSHVVQVHLFSPFLVVCFDDPSHI